MSNPRRKFSDTLVNGLATGLLKGALKLPYRTRVRFVGGVVCRVIAPLAGWNKRIRANLAHVQPDLPAATVERIVKGCTRNAGRTLIEIYSGAELAQRAQDLPLEGPGAEDLEAAHKAGKSVILVTGHFGNYDVARAALIARGYNLGALYRPMSNEAFNAHYVEAISSIGKPVFPSDRKGFVDLLKFIRSDAMAAFLIDIYAEPGAPTTYFGQPAPTATSAADLALKYNAALIPIYGIRQANGFDFKIVVDEPIPHSDPVTMTQGLNDSLEAHVRNHMEQWFWIHRRWKPERQRALAAAKMGP